MNNIPGETWIRTVIMAISLVNQILTTLDKNPIPVSEDEWYSVLTALVTIGATVWAWWKNNSFTKAAIKADAYMNGLKK